MTAAPFVGRTEELAVLLSALDACLAGAGSVMLLEGEPGVGKSRLAAELDRSASDRCRIVRRRCGNRGAALPVTPWPELAEAIGANREGPAVTGSSEPLTASSMHDLHGNAITQAAVADPVLLIIDDLHLASDDAILVLEQVAARCTNSHLLLVAAYQPAHARRAPVAAAISRVRALGATLLRLRGLSEESATTLLAAITGSQPPVAFVADAMTRTRGNPLFLTEISAVACDQPDSGQLWEVAHTPSGASSHLGPCRRAQPSGEADDGVRSHHRRGVGTAAAGCHAAYRRPSTHRRGGLAVLQDLQDRYPAASWCHRRGHQPVHHRPDHQR